jgi:8-oxo-dGTP pyrophosphatase MutT (NUDIX family)
MRDDGHTRASLARPDDHWRDLDRWPGSRPAPASRQYPHHRRSQLLGDPRPGEDAADAARREFFEETGYRVDPADLSFVLQRDLLRPHGTTEHRYCYTATYDGVQPIACNEGQAMQFIDPATFSSIATSPGVVDIILVALERHHT